MAEQFLNKAGVSFEKVYADQNPALAEQYDIHQAPTLVEVADGTVNKIVNLSNIKAYAEQAKLKN